jgi:hypothetical protein
MELSRGAQQEGRLAKQALHLPFTRLERRKSLIERGCFSHVAEHKSNSIGAADVNGNWKDVGYPAFLRASVVRSKRPWLIGE